MYDFLSVSPLWHLQKMSKSLFTSYLSARWRITLGVAVILLLLVAVTWPSDPPAFEALGDTGASKYLQSISGKISNALPDWPSSHGNGGGSAEWPGMGKEHSTSYGGKVGIGIEVDEETSPHSIPPTIKEGSDSHVWWPHPIGNLADGEATELQRTQSLSRLPQP